LFLRFFGRAQERAAKRVKLLVFALHFVSFALTNDLLRALDRFGSIPLSRYLFIPSYLQKSIA
jgi:hypothetical protein